MTTTAAPETPSITTRRPTTAAETRAAVKNLRGEPNGGIREVILSNYQTMPDTLDVHGPKDGRELIIRVESGIPHLHIRSGNVTAHMHSSWGNAVTVHDGAQATVHTSGTKLSTTTEKGGHLTLKASPDSRGLQYVHVGGTLELDGPQGRMTVAHQTVDSRSYCP